MATTRILSKEQVARVVSDVPFRYEVDIDYLYEIYEMANEAIQMLDKQNVQIEVKEINQNELLYYCIGEYFYSVSPLNKEEIEKFNKNENFSSSMASVAADKYLSLSIFNHVEKKLANRFLPPGLDGIEKGMTPPEEITENIYLMTESERKAHGIDSLPGNLLEAVECLSDDPLMVTTLGEHVYTHYTEGKRREWDEYRTRVTDWEIKKYMLVY